MSPSSVVISTTYNYALKKGDLEFLADIKRRTGVSVAKQMDYCLVLYRSEFDWDPAELLDRLKAYVATVENQQRHP